MRLIELAIVFVLNLTLGPLALEAQPTAKIARIGYLAIDQAASPHLREAFLQELRDLGYIEGRNLVIEYRSAEGKSEQLPDRKSTRLNSSHSQISYAVFCLKKK